MIIVLRDQARHLDITGQKLGYTPHISVYTDTYIHDIHRYTIISIYVDCAYTHDLRPVFDRKWNIPMRWYTNTYIYGHRKSALTYIIRRSNMNLVYASYSCVYSWQILRATSTWDVEIRFGSEVTLLCWIAAYISRSSLMTLVTSFVVQNQSITGNELSCSHSYCCCII